MGQRRVLLSSNMESVVTFFCFLDADYSENAYMEPLDAETIHQAKVEAANLIRQHRSATAARIYLDTEEVAVLKRSLSTPDDVVEPAGAKRNQLLAVCGFKEGRPITLSVGEVLCPDSDTVWFPVSAVVQIEHSETGVLAGWVDRTGGVGLMEAVMDGDPSAVWRVRAPGVAIALSTTEVVTLLARSTEFRLAVMRWLHQSILEARRLNITNVQGQATARVSWLLSHLCRAHSHREFAIEQAEIARLLGLQRTTVCGAMVSLKQHGLIAHMRGRVRVLNHDRLEELANAGGVHAD